jgi:short subunit dehydrogenase-like uncharacterized protein
MRPLLPLMRVAPLRRLALKMADRTHGPSAERRARSRVELWGRVTHPAGREVTMTMTVAEGYDFTVVSSLEAVKEVLREAKPGAWTPATAFGAGFVTRFQGTVID